jgi:restriction system protein
MTEITQQRISEILRIAFDLLWFEPAGLYVHEILDHINSHVELTSEEKEAFAYAPELPRYEIIVRVGSIPLAKAGWLDKSPSGKWCLTEKGRRESRKYSSAEDFLHGAIQEYDRWRQLEFARRQKVDSLVAERAEELAWEQIRHYLRSLPPVELLDLVGELLQALGYHVVWRAPAEKHRGQTDLVARLDPLGLEGRRVVVHVHHASAAASVDAVHSFMSSLNANDQGLFLSLSGFTSRVSQEVYGGPDSTLRLMDLDEFVGLWVQHQPQLPPQARDRLPLKPVYFLRLPFA